MTMWLGGVARRQFLAWLVALATIAALLGGQVDAWRGYRVGAGEPTRALAAPVRVDPHVVPPPPLTFTPTRYTIQARLDPVAKTVAGALSITLTNDSPDVWSEVWLHLYPNAFEVEAGAPTFVALEREYPRGFNPASMRVTATSPVELHPDSNGKNTLARYPLASALAPGGQTEIKLEFTATIPEAQSRFSHFDEVFALGNWYPTLAIYENGAWRRDPYYRIGDPFYTPVANYRVTFDAPADMLVGATGVEQSQATLDDGWRRREFESGLARDFAVVASARYRELSRVTGDVTVRSLYVADNHERFGELVAQRAVDAIESFGRRYGQYPYRVFTAAETYFPGGMEYPTLVMLGSTLYSQGMADRGILDLLVAHEVAHQWWYGVVGNDQILEPWLDEGVAEYATYDYLQRVGHDRRPTRRADLDDTGLFYRSVPSYGEDDRAYNQQIYEHGAEALFELRQAIGSDTLDQVFRVYFERWQYRIARVDDWLQVLDEVAGPTGRAAIATYLKR